MSQIIVTVTGSTPAELREQLLVVADALSVGPDSSQPSASEPDAPVRADAPTAAPELVEHNSPSVDLPTLRSLLVRLNQAGRKDDVKALLAKYGADRLSGIPAEQYGALYADAQELLAS